MTITTTTYPPTYPTYYHRPTGVTYHLDPAPLTMLGEGADRTAYSLGDGLVLKIDDFIYGSGSTEAFQCIEEVLMYQWLDELGYSEFATTIYSDVELARKGFVVAEEVDSLYLYMLENMDEDEVDDVVYYMEHYDYTSLDPELYIYDHDFAEFLNEMEIRDFHIDNLGCRNGQVVMLDLGWGSELKD